MRPVARPTTIIATLALSLAGLSAAGAATPKGYCPPLQNGSPSLTDLRARLQSGNLGAQELILLRNTVFARRGRTFVTPWIQENFLRTAWYRPDPRWREHCTDKDEDAFVRDVLAAESAIRKSFDAAATGARAASAEELPNRTCLRSRPEPQAVEGYWNMDACRFVDCSTPAAKQKADALGGGASVRWKGTIAFPDPVLPLSMRVTITELTTCEPVAGRACTTKPADHFLFCWLNPTSLGCDAAPLKTVDLGTLGAGVATATQPIPVATAIQASLARYLGCWDSVSEGPAAEAR